MANFNFPPKIVWGKHKPRSQMCDMFTEDGKIVDIEMDVARACLDDDIRNNAFLADSTNQYRGESGAWVQPLWERTAFPIACRTPRSDEDFTDLLDNLFAEAYEIKEAEQFKKAREDQGGKALWTVCIVMGSLLVVSAMIVLPQVL